MAHVESGDRFLYPQGPSSAPPGEVRAAKQAAILFPQKQPRSSQTPHVMQLLTRPRSSAARNLIFQIKYSLRTSERLVALCTFLPGLDYKNV